VSRLALRRAAKQPKPDTADLPDIPHLPERGCFAARRRASLLTTGIGGCQGGGGVVTKLMGLNLFVEFDDYEVGKAVI